MTMPLELSRPFPVENLGRRGEGIVVEATANECAAVARRLMLPAIASLRCTWDLQAGPAGSIAATGRLQASVTQVCVVSADAFDATVAEPFEVEFVLAGQESEADDPDAPDQIVYAGNTVDLGEAAVEQLALALDPYPRKPMAALPAGLLAEEASAFAALAKLRRLS